MHHAQIHASLYTGEANPGINEQDFAELADHLKVIERHRAEAGRSNLPFDIVAGMGPSLDSIRRCEEMGVTTYTVGPGSAGLKGTKDAFTDWIKGFADDVLTKI
jgi:hypothetical protein